MEEDSALFDVAKVIMAQRQKTQIVEEGKYRRLK
jgi:hypothetical protein